LIRDVVKFLVPKIQASMLTTLHLGGYLKTTNPSIWWASLRRQFDVWLVIRRLGKFFLSFVAALISLREWMCVCAECVFALLVTHSCFAANQRQKQHLNGEHNKERETRW